MTDFYSKIRNGDARPGRALDPFQIRLARAIFGVTAHAVAAGVCARLPGSDVTAIRNHLAHLENYRGATATTDPTGRYATPEFAAALAETFGVALGSLTGDREQLRMGRLRYRAWVADGRPPILDWVRDQDDIANPASARWLPAQQFAPSELGLAVAASLHVAAWHHQIAATAVDPALAAEHRAMARVVQVVALARATTLAATDPTPPPRPPQPPPSRHTPEGQAEARSAADHAAEVEAQRRAASRADARAAAKAAIRKPRFTFGS